MDCTFVDPLKLSLPKLKAELCYIGSYEYCQRCRICNFGREYVKRVDAAKGDMS